MSRPLHTRALRACAGLVAFGLVLTLGCVMQAAPKVAPPLAKGSLPHRPEELPPLDSILFNPPTPQYVELPNGIKLYVLENHELPIVSVSILMRNGARYDPPGKPGVAQFTSQVMRRGGSVAVPGDVLDDSLDFLAAHISMGMDVEYGAADLDVMRKDFDAGLSLLAGILMTPALPQEKLDEWKRLASEDIRRRNDDPYEIGRRRFRQVVYGMENPWAKQMELEDVERITRADLVEYHRTFYKPNITWIAVSGDLSAAEAIEKIQAAFASWQVGEIPEAVLPPVGQGMAPGVYIVAKQVSQSAIRMGSVGFPRHDPDEYAAAVMNQIFGAGTFTSRLGMEVRSNRGLAYYVFGAVFDSPDPRQGMFLALVGTRADKTHETIGVMRGIVDSMSTQPITDQEMQSAKETIINSFIFQYASSEQIVNQQMRLAFDGYPPDYLETYIPRIRAVTKDDVKRVARKYLRAEEMRVLVVGDSTRFDQPLDAFGPVTVLPPDDVVETPPSP